jgi:hypothetical protein
MKAGFSKYAALGGLQEIGDFFERSKALSGRLSLEVIPMLDELRPLKTQTYHRLRSTRPQLPRSRVL